MSAPATLRDQHVVLREPVTADVGALLDGIVSSVAELRPWLPWARADYSAADAQLWISGELGDVHRFVIIDDAGELVGSCALNMIDSANQRANLGYWLRSDRTGHGYATTATRLLARHGLLDAGLRRIEVVMSVNNHASRRVAERAGATYEGRARQRLSLHGVGHDAYVYSFVADDFEHDSPD